MARGYPDYAYTLDFLKRLNDVSYQGKPLRNSFFYNGYNIWHTYQQLLFEDIKRFSKARAYVETPSLTFPGAAKYMASGIVMGILSVSAILKLWLLRTPVLIYTIDRDTSVFHSDFRLQELYEFLHDKNVPYVEYMHTVPGKSMRRQACIRKRATLYLEFLDFLFWISSHFRTGERINDTDFDFSDFTDEERPFASKLAISYVKSIRLSAFRIQLLHKILVRSKLKAIFAIDDVRYNQTLFLAAYQVGIPTYALQHGHFTCYHVGWLWDPSFEGKAIAPNVLLVWSQYWKDELSRLGTYFTPTHIIVGGTKRATKRVLASVLPAHAKEKITVLIPYETACPKNEVSSYIIHMLTCRDTRVVFKLRPDMSQEKQLAEYGLSSQEHTQLIAAANINDILEEIDVVVGVYSTYLYEMIAEGKPVGVLETSSDYGEGVVLNGLAARVGKRDLCSNLRRLAATTQEERVKRQTKLLGTRDVLLADTLSKIAHDHDIVSA